MLTKQTKNMLAALPSWMKMSQDEKSNGAKFLDVFGLELEEVERYLEETWNNFYIGSANLSMVDFVYKVPMATRDVIDQEGELYDVVYIHVDGSRESVQPAQNLREFLGGSGVMSITDDIDGVIYIRADSYMNTNFEQPFDVIEVNGVKHYEYKTHHIWNVFDEFGLMVGIRRLKGERNHSFKTRILDSFKNFRGTTKRGLVNAVSRNLGLAQENVKVGALADKRFVDSELLDELGHPNQKYIQYVEEVNNKLGFAWDHMSWDEAYWKSIEENNLGLHYLPHIWDSNYEMFKKEEIVSGIGDGEDLKIEAPKRESKIRNFKAYVGLRGIEEQQEELHPEIRFKYKVFAEGKIPNVEHQLEDYKYTVTAGEVIKLHFLIIAHRMFIYNTKITFDSRYPYVFQDNNSPGLEIITGETY
ncbi:MAG: hypothetical protein ACRC5C_09555, partial [Bacilli bacterium]